jgi:hypothetical protein
MRPEFAVDVETLPTATRYYLEVEIAPDSLDNEDGPHLEGEAWIQYTNNEAVPLSEIYLRLYPNLPGYGGQLHVTGVAVEGRPVEQPTLEANNSALRLPLAQPLPPGEVTSIYLTYTLLIPVEPEGYGILAYQRGILAMAGFYPTVAVYDDEGWDLEIPPTYGDATYLDVSLYRVELTAPKEMTVVASGALVGEASHGDGTHTWSLASGPMRDFYVVMGNDYAVASETVDGVVVNSYYPSASEEGGQLALRYAADALTLFNDRFGPYPYAELDVVATPTTAGGVEYPGVIVIAGSLYAEQGDFFRHAIAHEVAHQWWYGVVGNDQIDAPWLDESLTNYSTIFYWEEFAGEEQANTVLEGYFQRPYERAKNLGQDRPVAGSVADFSEGEYSTIVYGKGALFFDALRRQVGDDTYLKIMQTYYADYKYKIATPDDLFGVIERVSGQDVGPLRKAWIEGGE